ncbi:unnamed protein product [Closterium sp. NIES-54]
MHPRNRYAENPPDFRALAEQHPALSPFVLPARRAGGPVGFMWSNYNATRELTRALLHTDFGVDWWIEHGHLCPTVPNRTNYLLWLHDLIASLPPSSHGPPPACGTQVRTGAGAAPPGAGEADGGGDGGGVGAGEGQGEGGREGGIEGGAEGDGKGGGEGGTEGGRGGVRVVDIGTGANLIYPLLGAAMFGWSFLATEGALQGAQANRARNPHLAPLIDIRRAGGGGDAREGGHSLGEDGSVKGDGVHGVHAMHADGGVHGAHGADGERLSGAGREVFDACMCNPPFFESLQQAGANPRTACGGTAAEMVCAGGELAFIRRIVHDSCALRTRIRWYTSMVGRKVNLKHLLAHLRSLHVSAAITPPMDALSPHACPLFSFHPCRHICMRAYEQIPEVAEQLCPMPTASLRPRSPTVPFPCQVPRIATTEFVQGRTSRWGIAWSFIPLHRPSSTFVLSRSCTPSTTPTIGPSLPTIGPSLPTIGPSLPTIGPSLPTIGPSLPTIGPSLPTIGPSLPTIGVTTLLFPGLKGSGAVGAVWQQLVRVVGESGVTAIQPNHHTLTLQGTLTVQGARDGNGSGPGVARAAAAEQTQSEASGMHVTFQLLQHAPGAVTVTATASAAAGRAAGGSTKRLTPGKLHHLACLDTDSPRAHYCCL